MLSHGRDRVSLVRFLYRALRPVPAPESMLETTSPSLLVRLSENRPRREGVVAILGVTVTKAFERLSRDGTEPAHKSSGLARNREGARLLAAKRNFLRIFFLKNTIRATLSH